MKTLIIYESTHHGNTFKLVDAIEDKFGCDLRNLADSNVDSKNIDWDEYALIGIASGVAYGKFYARIENWVKNHLPDGKKVFLLYTYGTKRESYTSSISEIIRNCGSELMGSYGCLGFDTFGPLKLVGGIAKGHPDEKEIEGAVSFYEGLRKSLESKD